MKDTPYYRWVLINNQELCYCRVVKLLEGFFKSAEDVMEYYQEEYCFKEHLFSVKPLEFSETPKWLAEKTGGVGQMKRVIKYEYHSWDIGCGCCHDSSSSYCIYEDGVLVDEDVWCEYASNEDELREILAHLEPFDVDSDSEWF